MSETDKLTEAVLKTHPQYDKRAKEYEFFEESYKGGCDYVSSGNLFEHAYEDSEGFADRKKRAYFYNYCAPIVNAYNSFIYRQEIQRDFGSLDENPLFAKFKDNVDRQGHNYEEFFRSLSKWASVSGLRFLLVDKPSQEAQTQKEELEGNIYPYLVHIDPQNVIDWGLDDFGNLEWIKIRETARDAKTFDQDTPASEFYRIWYKDRWELWEVERDGEDKKARKTEEGNHPIGEVPVIQVYHVSEDPMRGFSLLNDIAYVNRALFNWCSLLDEILYRQTFSQLVYPEDQSHPVSSITLGTQRGIGYPAGGDAPDFISPDASQATVIMQQVEKGVEEIYRLATLRGAIGVEEQSSGVARSYDFMITNNTLSDKAKNMESVETRALRYWARWQGIEDPQATVQYPNEFEISSLSEEIQNVISAQTLQISNRFEQILKERIVKRMAPRLPKEDMDLIEAEIKAPRETVSSQRRDELTNQVNNILGTGNGQGNEQTGVTQ